MKQLFKKRADLYASDGDFCRIFKEDMQSLYLLALVLTADPEKAEQCFVSGLDDCASGNHVFKAWARSWARRVVIKNAIRSAAASTTQAERAQRTATSEGADLLASLPRPELPAEIAALLALPARERFAFVMSFCEGYADRDCSLLLGCTREELIKARTRALNQLKDSAMARSGLTAGTGLETANNARREVGILPVRAELAVSA